MNARARKTGQGIKIHHSRDWEYPWVIIQSKPKSGQKVLDCGSGYSPLPFLWSSYGLEVHAVDTDTKVCTKTKFAFLGFKKILFDIIRAPVYLYFLYKSNEKVKEHPVGNTANISTIKIKQKKKRLFKVLNHLYSYIQNLVTYFSRAIKPDFWGPIPPKMIKKYKINYKNGKEGDFTKLSSYPKNYFDIVTCVSVFEHMDYKDRLKGLKEMSRVLKKGGKLILTFDVKNENEGKKFVDEFIKKSKLTPKEIVFLDRKLKKLPNHSKVIGLSMEKQ